MPLDANLNPDASRDIYVIKITNFLLPWWTAVVYGLTLVEIEAMLIIVASSLLKFYPNKWLC